MRVFVVYWHPEPQSFNAAMFQTARETLLATGQEVRSSDLLEMDFDPVFSRRNFTTVKDPRCLNPLNEEIYASEMNGFAQEIETEIRNIEWCDLMIWQFPLWWFGLPAVFKGWVDRVFAMKRTYGIKQAYGSGLFRGKRALLSLTTGGPEETYLKGAFNGDIHGILRPIQRGVLQFVGFDVLAPQIVYAPDRMTDEQRKDALAGYASRLRSVRLESPIDVGIY